jgi:uncharacterized membrane protein
VLERLKQDLKNDLIAGLLVVIPLATTIWLTTIISQWVFTFLTRVPKQLNPLNDLDPLLGNLLNLLTGLAVPLFSILFIGLMARNIVGRWFLEVGERILQAIPFAGSLYTTLKQLLETLLRDTNDRFRRVVLIEYPRRGTWALAFVTGVVTESMQDILVSQNDSNAQNISLLSIFVPTTPNPTTGWYAIVPEQDVVDTEISVEDAFKVLISGGVVAPNGNLDKRGGLDKRTLEPRESGQQSSEQGDNSNNHRSPGLGQPQGQPQGQQPHILGHQSPKQPERQSSVQPLLVQPLDEHLPEISPSVLTLDEELS